MPDFELPDVSDIFSEMTDAANAASASAGDISEAVGNLNKRLGQDSTSDLVKIDSDGIKVNGKVVKTLGDLEDALKTMEDGPAKTKMIDALSNPDLGNETPAVKAKAQEQAKANNQRQNLEDVFPTESDSADVKEDKYSKFTAMLKKSSLELFNKLVTYSVIGGATYAILDAMAKGKTGCYGVFGSQQELIYKTSSSTDCVAFQAPSSSSPNYVVNQNLQCLTPCQDYTQPTNTPATAAQLKAFTTPPNNMSCNCVDSTGALANPNVAIVYQAPTAFDIFGNILNGMGMFIEKLADGVLKIVGAAADVLADLPKILMWVGIAAAIVGVIVGFVFLGKKLHDKKKAKQGLQGGCWGSNEMRGGCWNQKKQLKHWKKSMKQVQRSTPYGQLTMADAIFN